jgi:carbamoyltransferase
MSARLESVERAVETPYPDVAAAVQAALEMAVERVAKSAVDDSRASALCMSGGVSLNCSSNGAIRDSGIADTTWVFPATGDAGLSVGAALLCSAEMGHRPDRKLGHAYLGPDYSSEQCFEILGNESRVTYLRSSQVASDAARRLAAGEVIGWFQGRMEFGPRSLGNRSILADPRSVKIRDRVNRIKRRESWRPFAPVIKAERSGQFFDSAEESPFMLFRTFVKPSQRTKIPGVVHVDGSARPQTLTREQNPLLYELLGDFDRLAGVPVLLNTSFNLAGEPIVCSPQDALTTFLNSELDALVIGDWIVTRRHRM